MINLDGYPVAPTDPSRLPYNAVGFPVPLLVSVIAAVTAAVAALLHVFTGFSTLALGILAFPFVMICIGGFFFLIIRRAVHAGLRMNDHDLYLDNSIEAEANTIQRGRLSPERVAAVSQGRPA